VSYNTQQTIGLAKELGEEGSLRFPELGLSAYSNEDLFHQEALLQRFKKPWGLSWRKQGLNTNPRRGAPLRVDSHLFNGAVVMYRGRILALP